MRLLIATARVQNVSDPSARRASQRSRKPEMQMAAHSPIEVIPTGAALAADVREVDPSRPETIDDAVFQAILDAWHEHLVLRFQGQKLNKDALLHFSRRFGSLDSAPIKIGGANV